VDVGRGVRLPVGAHGRASHSWWAMVVLVTVDMTIFVSLLYTHLHLAMASDVCPPPGAALPALRWPLAEAVLLAAGSVAMALATRALRAADASRQGGLRLLVALAIACAGASTVPGIGGHLLAGLDPRAQGWSASVGILLGYQAFHVAVLLLMGGYVLVRSWAGRLQPAARATIDNTGIMWHCVTVQGIVAALTVQLVPPLLG
jgi:cytochrome c oxidase subunit I+III